MHHSTSDVDYGSLFMSLPTPHVVIRPNADLTIVEQNEAHAKVTFTKRAAIVGQPLLKVFPDTSIKFRTTGVSDLIESIRKVARTKKSDTMPLIRYDLHNRKGELVELWWRITHYPLFDSAGEVDLIYQVTENITAEIKARERSERTTSQLNSALDIGLVSTWSWDMKNDVVTGDKNLARSFGVTRKRAQDGLPLEVFINSIHPEDRERISNAIGVAVNSAREYSEQYRTISHDGKVHWVIARGRLQNDADGLPSFFTGVLVDITEQKAAELRLADSEQEYKALFNSTIVAIAKANTAGTILQVNKTFLRIFGYTSKEFKQGMTSSQVSFYTNDTTTQILYNTLREYGEAEPVRKEYKRRDGSRFTGLVGAAMLPGSDDTFMAFIVDVTENEQLKELNRAKDDFVALASHQLRSPATIVKQYIGILLNEMAGPLSEDQLQYLNTANNANNRQLAIIDDLLKTAQIDTKGFAITRQPKNLVQLVREVIGDYQATFESRKQSVQFTPHSAIVIVRADASELRTCVANLLENASKYSPRDSVVTVDIAIEHHQAVLTVSDQGVGIAKANYEKVFQKFTRIDNELSDTVSGSGLGLYWVRRIVEVHDGQVSLKSKLGKGTTITVRLPL